MNGFLFCAEDSCTDFWNASIDSQYARIFFSSSGNDTRSGTAENVNPPLGAAATGTVEAPGGVDNAGASVTGTEVLPMMRLNRDKRVQDERNKKHAEKN